MIKNLKKQRKYILLIAIILSTITAMFGVSFLYYRMQVGVILAVLLLITALFAYVTDITRKKANMIFTLILILQGITIFFSTVFLRTKIQVYFLDFVIFTGILYIGFQIFQILKNKETKKKLFLPLLSLMFIVFSLINFSGRIMVNHAVAESAESYDNSKDDFIKGSWKYIKRDGNYTIRTIINRPSTVTGKNLPVIVNVHGGSWVFGKASAADGDSQALADDLGVIVVNLDYRLLFDKPFPNQQQELVDTVHYLYNNAEELGIDKNKINIFGQSAGGHITAGAGVMLAEENFPLNSTILFYPFSDFSVPLEDETWRTASDFLVNGMTRGIDLTKAEISPGSAPNEKLQNHSPVFLEIGTKDALVAQGEKIANRYEEAGVDITVLRVEGATHGFAAENAEDREEVKFQKSLEEQTMKAMKEFFEKQNN